MCPPPSAKPGRKLSATLQRAARRRTVDRRRRERENLHVRRGGGGGGRAAALDGRTSALSCVEGGEAGGGSGGGRGKGEGWFLVAEGGGKGKGVEIIAFGWTTKGREGIGNAGAIYWKKKGLYFATYFFCRNTNVLSSFVLQEGTRIE